MSSLNSGAGRCSPTHQLSLRPEPEALELGALPDVISGVLNAAHHANRHSGVDDRIAVALPDLHITRGVARTGAELVLFGTQAALGAYTKLEGVRKLVRRTMLKDLEIDEAFSISGEPGTAYVRDRKTARRSPGALRRARARAERRGVRMPENIEAHAPDRRVLALHYGSSVVHVRAIEADQSDQPLLVNTYGFSSSEAPAVLPILAAGSTNWGADAA